MIITYDRDTNLARFTGNGGFTEQSMREDYARGIARALDIPFQVITGRELA